MSADRLDIDRLAADVLAAVVKRSAGAKPNGQEQPFLCPLHDDNHPKGCQYNATKRAWRCHVCEAGGGLYGGEHGLASLLGLDLDDYREPTPATTRTNGHAKPKAAPEALNEPPDLGPATAPDWSRYVVTYDYRDADNALRFRVAKTTDKGFPVFQPAADGKRWHATTAGLPVILYGLPELTALAPGSTVFVVEGEKDANRLRAGKLDATTFPGWCQNRWNEAGAPLAGHRVVIVCDNDEPGRAKAAAAAAVAHGSGAASVRVLDFAAALGADGQPAMLAKGYDASDYLDNGGTIADLLRLGREAPEIPPPPPPRRTVETADRQLRDVGADALDVLRTANSAGPTPVVFMRGVGLAHVQGDDDGRPVIVEHGDHSIRAILARGATWQKTTTRKGGPHVADVDPPLSVVGFVHGVRDWDFPPLRALATAPILTPDWRILSRPGYDRSTGIVYAGEPFDVPEGAPSDAEREAARSIILDDLLGNFPFVNDASRAHAVAYAVLPFVRHAIRGPVACFLADAPTAGTGKTLLVEVLAWPFVGGSVPMAQPQREDELGKWILAKLMQGATHACIDNLPSKLDSAALASTITSSEKDGRILGKTLAVTIPNRTTWALTGNNVTMTEELARRAYWCRLDAAVEFPGDRDPTAFRHPNLKGWTAAHRRDLVDAILTMIRAWLHADRPDWSGRPAAGFEEWSRIVGGILETASIPGFLENARELWEGADPEAQAWRCFVEAWAEAHGELPVTAAELVELATGCGVLDPEAKSPTRSLGNGLRTRTDRIIAGWRIRKGAKGEHGVTWRLELPPKAFRADSGNSESAE